MKKRKIISLFSGIGAFEESLKQLNILYETILSSDTGEIYLDETHEELAIQMQGKSYEEKLEFLSMKYSNHKKTNFVKISYMKNHKTKEWIDDVRFIDGREYKTQSIDLLVGGSPCQSFSHIGKRGGFEDARGTLFYEYVRLLDETRPKSFIYENVVGITNIGGGDTWIRMQEMFKDIGYNIKVFKLDAKNFGLPQTRNRIFVIGSLEGELGEIKNVPLKFTVSDFLEKNQKIDEKYFLGRKGFEFVTNAKYKNRARVNSKIMMCQKANQQFNWNGDFVFWETNKFESHPRIHTSIWNGKIGVIRKLTPKEVISLMGFKNFKIDKKVPDVQLYRQAGNSIAVPVLNKIFKEVLQW